MRAPWAQDAQHHCRPRFCSRLGKPSRVACLDSLLQHLRIEVSHKFFCSTPVERTPGQCCLVTRAFFANLDTLSAVRSLTIAFLTSSATGEAILDGSSRALPPLPFSRCRESNRFIVDRPLLICRHDGRCHLGDRRLKKTPTLTAVSSMESTNTQQKPA